MKPVQTIESFPLFLTPFIGRNGELQALTEYITNPSCRLLTLIGPGGMGKTRLAIELAAQVSGKFDHGSVFVDLQPVETIDGVLPAIIDVLRLPHSGPGQPESVLFSYLQNRQMLFVLDNFEHLLDGAEHILDLLGAAPQVKVIVTSREALNLREEWLFPLAGLHFPSGDAADYHEDYASVRFFVNAVKQIVPDFSPQDNAQAIMRVCRLVEGMPLALELAASWIRTLTCTQIADEISKNLDILSTRVRNLPQRHHSIRAVFEQSYRLLTGDERTVFRRMAVFRGRASRHAAEQVTGSSLFILSALIDKSLLKQEPDGHYRMHELIRQFAQEELLQSPEEAHCARDAHGAYYLGLLHRLENDILWGEQKNAYDVIGRELDNVRAAWQWAIDTGADEAIRLAATTLFRFFQMQSRYAEAAQVFGAAVRRFSLKLPDDRPEYTLILLHSYLAGMLVRLGNLTQAEWNYAQVQAIYERLAISPVPGIGTDPTIMLADIAIVRGQYDLALALVAQRYDLNKWQNHTSNVLHAHHISARAALGLGDYDAAYRHARQGMSLADASGDQWFTIVLHHQLSIAAIGLQDYTMARQHIESSYAVVEEFEDPEGMARARLVLGEIALLEQRYSEAGWLYNESLDIYCELNDRGGRVRALNGLALAALAQGDVQAAIDGLRRALEIAAEVQYVQLMLFTLGNIAELLLHLDRYDESSRLLHLVLHHPATVIDIRARAETLIAQHDLQQCRNESIQSDSLASVVAGLLRAFPAVGDESPEKQPGTIPKFRQTLIEPLTEREQEVLFLVAEGLKNREIADKLYVTLGTVKSHINSIYGKLEVRNRVEAVSRAQELSLL